MGMPPHWTPTEYAAKLRSGLARAKEQIRTLQQIPGAKNSGYVTESVTEWRKTIEDLQRQLRYLRQRGLAGPSRAGSTVTQVAQGSRAGSTSEAMRELRFLRGRYTGSTVSRASSTGRLARFGQWVGRAGRSLLSLKALAVVATAVIVGGGAYLVTKSWIDSEGGERQAIAFIGPIPEDECTVGVAADHGLVWSEAAGWDLADRVRPDPAAVGYEDDAASYRADRDAYVADVNGRVYETFQAARSRCAGDLTVIGPEAAPCTAATYPATISGSVWLLTGATPTERTGGLDVLNRADVVVREDCSVELEVHRQVAYGDGDDQYCDILVALAEVPASSVDAAGDGSFTGRVGGYLGLVDRPCPAVDAPGNLDLILGGNAEAGQVGQWLSGASSVIELRGNLGPPARIEPFAVETGYARVTVELSPTPDS